MAKLYINKDIASDANKMKYWLSGDDCVSFSDIQGFLAYVDPADNNIDVELHSCGGDCTEGYAIYDALRSSGKEISCKVVGLCASMATVILLAAPVERRSMYQHAQLLIHNPFYSKGVLREDMTIEKLNSAAAELEKERVKMLNLYTERTGKDAAIIEAQMSTDSWFGSDKAIELGFVSSVVPAISAKTEQPIINNNKNEMETKEEKKPTIAEAFRMLGVALGITKPEAVGMEITTSTGDVLTVEREEGEIQVGDAASPDGEFVLEDGRTVVVEDGVITSIEEPSGEEEDDLQARIAELEKEVEELKANAKSDEEARILATVKKAGGEKWLNKAASSKYVPAGRAPQKQATTKTTEENTIDAFEKIRKAKMEKRKKN